MTDNLPPEGTRRQRWHDNRGDLSTMVDLLESIPEELRPHIAAALTGKADESFNAGEILRSLKSLGTEKIMMLHQSRKKRRAYDQDPDLHKIVDTFMVLPEDAQDSLATDCLAFTELIVEYMANCDTFELEPQEAELVRMRDLFLQSGAESVKQHLDELHAPYYKLIGSGEGDGEPESPSESPQEKLVQADDGLRIKDQQSQ